jgi:hypothetical protein
MTGNSTLHRLIKRTIYDLKRRYGAPVDVYKLLSNQSDPKRGTVDTQVEVYPLDRVIVLPNKLNKAEHRTISIISANKQMLQGGWYEADGRNFIIDRLDLPGVELTTDDWLVFQGRKYAFESLNEYELDMGWIVTGKALTGEAPQQVFKVKAESFVEFTSNAGQS